MLLLMISLFITDHAILTLLLMVLFMITGELLCMALITDTVRPPAALGARRSALDARLIGNPTIAGVIMGSANRSFVSPFRHPGPTGLSST